MPSVTENLETWSTGWDWSQRGEEWSTWWGGTPAFWYGALLPRIHSFIPTGSVLEIAPGYGRWTQFLKDVCDRLTIVDLCEPCIAHCRERFAGESNVAYHVNDGRSLAMVEDGSVDFAFSFDSLVHADSEVIGGYLEQLRHKLAPDGVGFIHHSNAGALRALSAISRRVPDRLFGSLMRRGVLVNLAAWRDDRMTSSRIRDQCANAGLVCVSQELVSWEFGPYLLDCFSVFTRRGSRWDSPPRLVRNPLFVLEARRMARLYAGSAQRWQGQPPVPANPPA